MLLYSFCRCSILGILHKYKVAFPRNVIDLLKPAVKNFETRMLQAIHFVDEEEGETDFQDLQMNHLKTLNDNLRHLFEPIAHHIKFLVFFCMHKSHLFSQYLQDRLQVLQSSDLQLSATCSRESLDSTMFAGMEDILSNPGQDSTIEHLESRQTMKVSITLCMPQQDIFKFLLSEYNHGIWRTQ